MHFPTSFVLLTSAFSALAAAVAVPQSAHGEGAENEQGPVGFLWPSDREWDDDDDNTGPCGTATASSNRTSFPLLNGAIALTILDDAEDVFLRISYKENPASQDDFTDLTGEIEEIEAGHQCYNGFTIPRDVEAGDKATLQLEYRAEDDGVVSSQYACADIVFVANSQFTATVPCFNVTSDEFVEKEDSETSAAGSFGVSSVVMAAAMGVAAFFMA